jgi:hypothetical protein
MPKEAPMERHPDKREADERLPEELSPQELEAEGAQALPDREAMSTIGLDLSGVDNFAMPINEAIAINNQSIASTAYADADQTIIIGQDVSETEGDG